MKIEIEKAENGYIISYYTRKQTSPEKTLVEADGAEGMARLANELSIILGLSGSRHDEKRFYAVVAPGDKNGNFMEEHEKVLYNEYN